jgi:hypothetical protein
MKNLIKLTIGLLFASLIITGCKEAEELLYVNFPADYTTEIDISIPSSDGKISTNGTFSESETIDPTTNSDYLKYIDNIKEVKIEEVTGEVLEISKNVLLQTGTINIKSNDHEATWQFNNVAIETGTVLTLDNNQLQWDQVSSIMLGKIPFTVSIDGQTDEDDVEFVILLSIKSDITASPLN